MQAVEYSGLLCIMVPELSLWVKKPAVYSITLGENNGDYTQCLNCLYGTKK